MKNIIAICLVLLVGLMTSFAQTSDPFAEALYEPDLVTSHKKEIELTNKQESKINSIYTTNSVIFNEKKKQWSLAMIDFQSVVSEPHVDYHLLDEKFSKVLFLESEIKKIRLVSLAEIKNELTPEQQVKLNQIKARNPNYKKAFELNVTPFGDGTKIVITDTDKLTISDDQLPMYVFFNGKDKIPVIGRAAALADIDPNNIASMSVLKGTAATNKYGNDGKNGVIEITLKNKN
jgi:Spy/CpxP family protein refolding chaperone